MFRFAKLRVARAISVIAMTMITAITHASELRTVYYDVVGTSARELRRELNAKGPLDKHGKKVSGLTRWKISWKFHKAAKAGSCEFTEFKATLDGTITMPRWVVTQSVPKPLMDSWQRFLTALLVHEQGHYSNGFRAAEEVRALGRGFRVPGDCSTIATEFNERATAIIDKYRIADDEYDRRTQSGRTQGVKFP